MRARTIFVFIMIALLAASCVPPPPAPAGNVAPTTQPALPATAANATAQPAAPAPAANATVQPAAPAPAATATVAQPPAAAATPAGAVTPAPEPTGAAKIPLADAVKSMDPQDVWQNFYDLTQIPRPSHHEEKVSQFLAQFGKSLGLETIVDDVGDVIIRKPAAKGMENRRGVVLQAHMDMVPQKAPDKDFDFLTDPIEASVDGAWVHADGTTLGADDGSGIAIAMAALQSKQPFGPLEALFTVNEEDGMTGATNLKPGVLQGDILLNLDSETEGEFTIGSAGGETAKSNATYPLVAAPANTVAYSVTIGGLRGGHSGVDIDLGRGHATKLLVRLLRDQAGKYGISLATLAGGTISNAIPTTASALILVPTAQASAFESDVKAYQATLKNELAIADPGVTATAVATAMPSSVLDPKAQQVVIDVLYANPQGVLRMSDTVPGLVETSTNMGIVNLADGKLAVSNLMRSSVDTELQDVHQMMASAWELAGIEPVFSDKYSAWQPNPNSPIVLLMESVYQDLYGREPKVTAVHAGLEAGTIKATYPNMDAISIGPTLQNVHSPDERIQIDTVKKLNDLVVATLQEIPVASGTPAAPATPAANPTAATTTAPTQPATVTPAPTSTAAPTAAATAAAGLANPASVNCTKQGGTSSIQTNATGGQYGVCTFENNQQCQEWALLRGDCPVGGVKVTGYVTQAAQYCVITGGTYKATGNNNTPKETGTCTLKNGQVCDATAYWNGEC